MIASVSDLLKVLDRYARGEIALAAMHDEMSLSLQELFDNISEDDAEMVSEVMAAMYEVEDGVMPEEEFRSGLQHLIREQRKPRIITVGSPAAHISPLTYFEASTAASDAKVPVGAA